MSILLICAPFNVTHYSAPQLGPYRLQAYLQKNDIECDIFDPTVDDLESYPGRDKFYSAIGISGTHFNMQRCLELVDFFVRDKERQILLAGGSSPSNNWQQWLEAGMDAVVLGYGEAPLASIGHLLQKDLTKDDILRELAKLDGIAMKRDGLFVKNPSQKLTKELFDTYTYHNALELHIPYKKYWDFNQKRISGLSTSTNPFIVKTSRIYTSSQCPNQCGYCSSKFLAASQGAPATIFFLDAQEIFHLICDNIKKYNCEMIFFNDDEFLFHRKRIIELCHLIIDAKKNGSLPRELKFECQSRVVDFLDGARKVDSAFVTLLKEAGFRRISVGAENFCENLLATPIMNKSQFTHKNVEDLVASFRRVGMLCQINIMLLIPEATKKDVLFNIQRAIDLIALQCPVNLNVKLLAEPGAPATVNALYEKTTTSFQSPLNSTTLVLPQFFVPRDPDLLRCFEHYDSLYPKVKELFLARKGISHGWIMNTYLAGIACLTVLRTLGESTMYDELFQLLLEL